MSTKHIRNTAKVLLLLYIGYFGCVSYFVHSHVFNGVIYVHSHPYKKWKKENGKDKEPPFETHHHTSAGFFTLNQLSSLTSFEGTSCNYLAAAKTPPPAILHEHYLLQRIVKPYTNYFNLRAPPVSILV
ncbi:MAG: hypothetical protein ACK5KT_05860 [Dysgonomonas sp.]